MIQIIATELGRIERLRLEYLHSLPEFQELYLELLTEDSDCFLIFLVDKLAGYSIVTRNHVLVEFYMKTQFIPQSIPVFRHLVSESGIEKVLCKSFDALLLNCCLECFSTFKTEGTLFRQYTETPQSDLAGIEIRMAEASDIPFLLLQQDGLYETPQELDRFVRNDNVVMFISDGNLLGCGFRIQVHPAFNYYDIGMWVNPQYRRQGIATKIISYLKNNCIDSNQRPICGCAYENFASQKTLEKAGFVSKYRLLGFEVK